MEMSLGVFHKSGRKTKDDSRFSMMLVMAALLFMAQLMPMSKALTLNPSTPPAKVIEQQLDALKDGDIGAVYKFASPGNKLQTGDVTNFARMVRSGPYRYLVGHSRSEILLESKMAESRQFLVRVISSLDTASSSPLDLNRDDIDDDDEEGESDLRQSAPQKKVLEYWWSLSRCKTGEFSGSYMVDAVIPNQM